MDPLQHLTTESRNTASNRLDELTSVEIVQLMNAEDRLVAEAVASQTQAIARAIEAITHRLGQGGRLIYLGAGTSGRLGVLDAAECPPTFQTDPQQILGLIAGGPGAMFQAVEGAEDSPELGARDLAALGAGPKDVVCGIATSGRTPYVLGAIRHAREVGTFTIGIACNPESPLEKAVHVPVVLVVGPEVLSGSTRLKAGTATKLVLNMFTTGAMVLLGKTYGNLMVDLKATNEKLKARANRIVRTITGLDEAAATQLLSDCEGEVKTAIVTHRAGCSTGEARTRLQAANGRVNAVFAELDRIRISANQGNSAAVSNADLVLGIDGGGTSTIALLASATTGEVLGRGSAGPSNIQAIGVERGLAALDLCIERAFLAANLPRQRVAAICMGLAGIDRQEGLNVIHGWAERASIAAAVEVANDATLLLAAGTPDGWGLAVIAGTGSIAFVRTLEGKVGRCGGWGYLLGDEGSAYRIALTGLQAACRSFDGIAPPTRLVQRFVQAMNLREAPDLIPAVYRGPWDRSAIAGLAPVVMEEAIEGDSVAIEIVKREARELAATAAGAVLAHGLPHEQLPIALAGGVLTKSEIYREEFLGELRTRGLEAGIVQLVTEPAIGAVVLARNSANRLRGKP